jgi:LmbE family N-acetylglucosaminyl deacetylase
MDASPKCLLVVAPHPDDDVLSSSALIARTLAAGGAVHVAFLTDGERNSLPQRRAEKRWRINSADRLRWGARRRNEALEALAILGVDPRNVTFFGLPDQKLASMARRHDASVRTRLRKLFDDVAPTMIMSPSAFDRHPDHRAGSFFVHDTIAAMPRASEPALLTYSIHGRSPAHRRALTLTLTAEELQLKRRAIECHRSQLLLSARRFRAHATRTESYLTAEFDYAGTESRLQVWMSLIRHAAVIVLRRHAGSDLGPVR